MNESKFIVFCIKYKVEIENFKEERIKLIRRFEKKDLT
jgi:hypothetical protein